MNINYIKLLTSFFKQLTPNENISYNDIIKETLFEYLYDALKNIDSDFICREYNDAYDIYGCFRFVYYSEHISDILFDFKIKVMNKIIYHNEDYKKVSSFKILYDFEEMSDNYDIDGTAFEKYIGFILLDCFEIYQGIQELYIHQLEKEAVLKIESYFLESLYNPRTILGKKRFDREFDKLIN